MSTGKVSKYALPMIPKWAFYIAARTALRECSKIDECKSWADKAAALASYAKQSEDDRLMIMARRIKARAIRRCGELLREIEDARGKHWETKRDGGDPSISRKQAAKDAGLSERQRKQAINIARAPNADEQIDSDEPPTVEELAKQGRKSRVTLNSEGEPDDIPDWLTQSKPLVLFGVKISANAGCMI